MYNPSLPPSLPPYVFTFFYLLALARTVPADQGPKQKQHLNFVESSDVGLAVPVICESLLYSKQTTNNWSL